MCFVDLNYYLFVTGVSGYVATSAPNPQSKYLMIWELQYADY